MLFCSLAQKLEFCEWFLDTLHNDDGTLNFFTDEAWFYANPHLYAESFLYPEKLGNCTIFEKSTSINFPHFHLDQ
jgi:hypothetical protein